MGCSFRRAQAGGSSSDGGVAAHGEQSASQQSGGHPQVRLEGRQLRHALHTNKNHSNFLIKHLTKFNQLATTHKQKALKLLDEPAHQVQSTCNYTDHPYPLRLLS